MRSESLLGRGTSCVTQKEPHLSEPQTPHLQREVMMLTTSQGGRRDYVKLHIWYKVLSTVLGILYVLSKYELLS